MDQWKQLFKRQLITVSGLRRLFGDQTESQQVLLRSDAYAICRLAVIDAYKDMVLETHDPRIIEELERLLDEDDSGLGM